MKKLLLIPVLTVTICILSATTKAQSPRLQLLEYFDNNSIPPYIYEPNKAFDTLAGANLVRVIPIKYHVAWGSQTNTDSMNLHNAPQAATRVAYYGINADPNVEQDGAAAGNGTYHGLPLSFTQSMIDTRDAVTSPFTIEVSHDINASQDTIACHVKIVQTGTVTGLLRAHVVVIEDMIEFGAPQGVCNDSNFDYVMKRMLPSATGTLMSPMNIGDSLVLDLKWKLAHVYDVNHLAVVSFVQDTSHEVLQAGYSAPTVTGLSEIFRDESTLDVYPNPTSGMVAIIASHPVNDAVVEVYSSFGELILKTKMNLTSTKEINLHVPAGMYFIKISNSQKQYTKKLIVQ